MTRTASCFFALSIGIALAAACGDDDGGDGVGGAGGGGGSGGAGASGGAAGTGGDAGSGGDAGTGGTAAGTGGDGGGVNGGSSGSSAGTAGSSAGTAGSSAGTAGTSSGGAGSVEEGDAGPDGSADSGPDSSVAGSAGTGGTAGTGSTGPVDSGLNGDCPSFPNAGNLAVAGAQNGQQVVIARIIFNTGDDSAKVVLRGVVTEDVGDPFYSSPKKLCSGPEDADCVDIDALDLGALTANGEVEVTIGNVTPDEGEIALISNFPEVPQAFTFAYVAWGEDFISETPDPGGNDAASLPTSLDERADEDGFWDLGGRIEVTPQTNTIVGIGDTIDPAAGFTVCTGDDL